MRSGGRAPTPSCARSSSRWTAEHPLRELREAGIGGACPECGAVYGSADRFCASCGEPLRAERHRPTRDPLDERPT